ncbi:hypothetical protein [Brevundimonas sp.]|uniref:hypothetical protein n=1 Tax=Brevundimonas sp. TaxID=1871086 RepID=UPI00286C46EB|nr:hypothetical protein [Brevundimonas sp.]
MYDLDNTDPVPHDLGTRLVFEKERIPLAQLVDALEAAGQTLTGRRFVDCVIHGPCVVMPATETKFDNCNLGDVAGDVRNLFLRSAGPMVIGAIPLNDSHFDGCIFMGVGFAGHDDFVNAFIDILTPTKA